MRSLFLTGVLGGSMAVMAGCTDDRNINAATGALTGAAVGSQIGSGSGRTAAALAGAAAGTAIGANAGNRSSNRTCLYRDQRTGGTYRAPCPN
nr:glycine zipper 2TM domain-containing protein [Rhodovulum euryhalinum]